MDISSITGSPGLAPNSQNVVDSADFFRLVTAQLRAQDPLEPVEESQFLGQLAQFAQLEESTNFNANLQALAALQENLAAIQQMTQGTQLIGQTVEYTDPSSGEARSGTVDAVRVQDGIVVLDIGGENVPLPFMTAVVQGEED